MVCVALGALATVSRADGSEKDVSDPVNEYQEENPETWFEPEQVTKILALVDKNRDHKTSMEEFKAFAKEHRKSTARMETEAMIHSIDTNKDGKLDEKELEEHVKDEHNQPHHHEEEEGDNEHKLQNMLHKFTVADLDGNGLLEEDEIVHLFVPETHADVLNSHAHMELGFRDRNDDEKLSIEEFYQVYDPEDEHDALADYEHEEFKLVDANQDGFIDLDEFTHWESGEFHTGTALKQLFSVADTNKDGYLTAAELNTEGPKLQETDAFYELQGWFEHHHERPEANDEL